MFENESFSATRSGLHKIITVTAEYPKKDVRRSDEETNTFYKLRTEMNSKILENKKNALLNKSL